MVASVDDVRSTEEIPMESRTSLFHPVVGVVAASSPSIIACFIGSEKEDGGLRPNEALRLLYLY